MILYFSDEVIQKLSTTERGVLEIYALQDIQ
jgi:hypothetical protein